MAWEYCVLGWDEATDTWPPAAARAPCPGPWDEPCRPASPCSPPAPSGPKLRPRSRRCVALGAFP
eukprot:5034692-Lingulodinium_polyedra.AAC.1